MKLYVNSRTIFMFQLKILDRLYDSVYGTINSRVIKSIRDRRLYKVRSRSVILRTSCGGLGGRDSIQVDRYGS
jgi:hypothetical protein